MFLFYGKASVYINVGYSIYFIRFCIHCRTVTLAQSQMISVVKNMTLVLLIRSPHYSGIWSGNPMQNCQISPPLQVVTADQLITAFSMCLRTTNLSAGSDKLSTRHPSMSTAIRSHGLGVFDAVTSKLR